LSGENGSSCHRLFARSRVRLALTGLVLAAGVAVTVGVLASRGGSAKAAVVVKPYSLLRINPKSGRFVSDVTVAVPGALTIVPSHQVWVLSRSRQLVTAVDIQSHRTTPHGGFGGPLIAASGQAGYGLAYANGYVWVCGENNTVTALDPTSGATATHVPLPGGPTLIAAGDGKLWVLSHDQNAVYSINATTDKVRVAGKTGNGTDGIAVGEGAVWVTNQVDSTVTEIPIGGGHERTIRVPSEPSGITAAYGAVWVSSLAATVHGRSSQYQTLARIDPAEHRVVKVIPIDKLPPGDLSDITAANHLLWVNDTASNAIAKVNPTTDRLIGRVRIPIKYPVELTAGYGSVWATICAPQGTC
jgi:sugar lactone lactonase YvrE